MLTINLKNPRLTLAVAVGLLAIAGPAGAGPVSGAPADTSSIQAHAPVSPTPSSGGHPSQGAPTVGGATKTEPEPYMSPTAAITAGASLRADKNEISIETLELGRPGRPRGIDVWETVNLQA